MVIFLHGYRHTALNAVPFQDYLAIGIAGASVIIAALLLPLNDHVFRSFVIDFVLCIIWFATFALLLLKFTKHDLNCDQGLTAMSEITKGGLCNSLRAAWGFAFLSGCVWLGTFLIGLWVVIRQRSTDAPKVTAIITNK